MLDYLTRTPPLSRTHLTFNQILYKVVVNEKSYGGLSIDWLNEKIYWSSAETVSVGELDGSVHTTLLQKEGFNFRFVGYQFLLLYQLLVSSIVISIVSSIVSCIFSSIVNSIVSSIVNSIVTRILKKLVR